MLTKTLIELNKARAAPASAYFNGVPEDFENIEVRVLISDIHAGLEVIDPDILRPQINIDAAAFTFEDVA